MRNVILNVAVSLDGYIEGPNGEFDWCFTDQDYGMKEFESGIEAIFFGRKSYDVLKKFEQHPYPNLKKYVFSRTLRSVPDATLISGDIEANVKRIKADRGKNIWLFGGADLVGQFVELRLVDELHLAVHPVVLGAGKPLFSGVKNRVGLKLLDSKVFSTGLVQLFYKTSR